MPDLSGLRCAGCVMSGGVRVRSKEEALDYSAVFVGRAKPIRVGTFLREGPCMTVPELEDPRMYWREAGRPCPRVELRDLADEAHLVMLLYTGSPNAGAFLLTRPRAVRRRLMDRAMAALTSPRVSTYLKRKREAQEKAERMAAFAAEQAAAGLA